MTKLHKITTVILLTAVMLLTGCAERESNPAPGAETNTNTSSDVSDGNYSESTESTTAETSNISSEPEYSTSETSDSVSEQQSSTEETLGVNIDDISIEFTEEDKELQEILKGLNAGETAVGAWITNAAPRNDQGFPLTESLVFQFPEINKPNIDIVELEYYPIPNGYSQAGFIMPNTCKGIREFMLEYLSERCTDYYMKTWLGKGSITENSDGTISVILEDKQAEGGPKLLEIDQKIYRCVGEGGRGLGFSYLLNNSARVVSRTDDTIEFTYLTDWEYYDYKNKKFVVIDNEPLYVERAHTGFLKYERGGWRRDWDKDDNRR